MTALPRDEAAYHAAIDAAVADGSFWLDDDPFDPWADEYAEGCGICECCPCGIAGCPDCPPGVQAQPDTGAYGFRAPTIHSAPLDLHKRAARIGGGGWRCRCCGPAPGDERKAVRRSARRRMRQADRREWREAA